MLEFCSEILQDIPLQPNLIEAHDILHSAVVCGKLFEEMPWLKERPDLGLAITVVLAGFDPNDIRMEEISYVNWIPWYLNITVQDVIDDWRKSYRVDANSRVHLRYMDSLLGHEESFLDAVGAIDERHHRNDDIVCNVYTVVAMIEDEDSPFGCRFQDLTHVTDYMTFGQYITRQSVIVDLLNDSRLLDAEKMEAYRPLLEYHQKAHETRYGGDEMECE